MTNAEVAEFLSRVGQILEIRGESFFKARAYYNAARLIGSLGEDINRIVEDGKLGDLPGFGEALTLKVGQLVRTGHMNYFDEISDGIPPGLLTLLDVPEVGPKKAKLFFDKLKISSVDELEAAARAGKLSKLAGMGKKSEEKILTHIEQYHKHKARRLLSEALPVAERILELVHGIRGVKRASLAGSIRRHLETIGDIDVLASAASGGEVIDAFTKLPGVTEIVSSGGTKGSVVFAPGIQCDLRVVEDKSYAAAQHYFTGSKDHNVHMRQLAKDRGWKLNEYGLFEGEKMIASQDEEDLFKHFGMDWIEPEMRENTGEIEASLKHKLPRLITEKDIKGLVHVHSSFSDGSLTIDQVADEVEKRGFKYTTLSDHSKAVYVAHGLDDERQKEQWKELEKVQKKRTGVTIFRSTEVDIKKDGSLDFSDAMMELFECTFAAVHSSFTMSTDAMTERVIKAVSHPFVDILAHPTGRLLLERDPYALDVEKVIKACVAHDVAIEINGHPARLDLDWRYVRIGKDLGAKFVISLDAHSAIDLDYLPYGVSTARKGWLEAGDVLNCLSVKDFGKWLSKRRAKKSR
jgi:DNA polymerase (family X)